MGASENLGAAAQPTPENEGHEAAASGTSPDAFAWGPMREDGRHYPVLGQRKFGATALLLRHRRDLWAIYRKHRLDPQFREEIMIAAAGADSSRQCSFAHREWARAEGLPEEELAALEGLDFDALDERRWAAFAWAQAYARRDFGQVPEDVDASFRRYFSVQEQTDIALAARTMYWLNETSNSVDAFLYRVKRNIIRDLLPGSTRLSELAALLLYAVVVPVLIVWLSIRQGRNPISMFRSMRPFFREFEARGPHTISGPGIHFDAN